MSSLDFFDQTQIKTECSPKVSLSRKIIKIIFFEIRPQITCITFIFSSFLFFYELTFFIFYILFFLPYTRFKNYSYDEIYHIGTSFIFHTLYYNQTFSTYKNTFFLLILKTLKLSITFFINKNTNKC